MMYASLQGYPGLQSRCRPLFSGDVPVASGILAGFLRSVLLNGFLVLEALDNEALLTMLAVILNNHMQGTADNIDLCDPQIQT